MMVLFWGGLFVLAVILARAFRDRPNDGGRMEHRRPDPQDILSERFARGEISEDEFDHRTRVLKREER